MNQDNELHPNWRALATVHLPYKRFVREGAISLETGRSDDLHTYEVKGVDGTEACEFYKEILSVEQENPAKNQTDCHKNIKITKKPKRQILLPFDKSKYFRFAMQNELKELEKLRISEDDINCCDNYGWTALMMAACEGADAVVDWLYKLGANKYIADKSGNTALSLARKKGHFNIVSILEREQNTSAHTVESNERLIRQNSPFYCDTCQQTFSETSRQAHYTSTVHQFNAKSKLPANKLLKFNISTKNRGLQLMVKQGWDREHGLGPSQSGRLYPVKTVLRRERTGLGVKQPPARVTHFEAFDTRATKRRQMPMERRRTRSDMQREKRRETRRNRRLRNELS